MTFPGILQVLPRIFFSPPGTSQTSSEIKCCYLKLRFISWKEEKELEVQVRRWSMVGKERHRSRRRNSSLEAGSCQERSRRQLSTQSL